MAEIEKQTNTNNEVEENRSEAASLRGAVDKMREDSRVGTSPRRELSETASSALPTVELADPSKEKTTAQNKGQEDQNKENKDSKEKKYEDTRTSWEKFWGKPHVTTDKEGNTRYDYGGGHTRLERKDGSGYDRYEDEKGSFREEHFGKNPADKYTVYGDGKGNKTTDYGNGHIRKENADGSGYDKTSDGNGGYEARHWGPKESDNYKVTADKDGNRTFEFKDGKVRVEKVDGSGYEKTSDGKGGSEEKHWGKNAEDNYNLSTDKDGNKTYTYPDGRVRGQNADGSGYERKPDGNGGSSEKHWGPKADDKYTLTTDKDGNKNYQYDDGRTRVESKDGVGYERQVHDDGSFNEKHFGPDAKDNFTRTGDRDGNVVTDWNDGHRKQENVDGTVVESWKAKDGSSTENHSGPKPEQNFKVNTDVDGNKTTDWGNGHLRVDNKDGTGYERTPSGDNGAYAEKHWGPKPEDSYKVEVDEIGKKTTTYEKGHVKVENPDKTGYEYWQKEDGSYKANFFGPQPSDNYTLQRDKEGTKTYDFGNGHTKVVKRDGTGYESTRDGDNNTIEKHFGPKPEDKYTVTISSDGNKLYDYGNGHTKREYKDGTTVERVPGKDGNVVEKHTGPKPEDNYTVLEDKNGKREKEGLTQKNTEDLTVRKGEGPYQAAKRFLGPGATHKEIMALVKAMKEEYAKNNSDKNMRGLRQGTKLITNENYAAVMARLSPDMQKKVQAATARK